MDGVYENPCALVLPNDVDLASHFFSPISKMISINNSDAPVSIMSASNPDACLGIKPPLIIDSEAWHSLSSYL
jgi:hypothetical protein